MKQIIIFILLTFNAVGLDFQFIAKVPTKLTDFGPSSKFCDRNDGAFIFKSDQESILVISTGQFLKFKSSDYINYSKTNIFIQNDNGKAIIIKEEVSVNSSFYNSGFTMLKTANQNNLIKEEKIQTNATTILYLISQDKTNIVSESSINENYTLYSKLNYSGEIIESKKTKTVLLGPSDGPFNDIQGFSSNKSVVTTEIKDGYIYFYRLTDSDLLSSPNRITLGSSQNGSLTATVNNPEQALLNIQSSTNLIDWNTFKTTKNEPSLEIVVPANKPKEFIRAIK
jgi:hypothetical protein